MGSRERTPGRTYLTKNDETLKNIEKMKALQALNDGSSEKDPNYDPYPEVITKEEHSGRVRLFGGGVTKAKLKSKDVKTPYIVPAKFLESIADSMKKSITEQVQKSLAKQMEQQMADLVSNFKAANPGMKLVVPDFLASQGDASSLNDDVDGDSADDN